MPRSDEGSGPDEEERGHGPEPRLGSSFVTVVAQAWRYYRESFGPLVRLFTAATVAVYLPSLVFLTDLSAGAEETIGYLLLVLLPPLVYSLAFAVAASVHRHEDLEDPVHARTAYRDISPNMLGLMSVALVASAASVLVTQIFGPYLFAVMYGPPVFMQVAAIERLPAQAAWRRTKELLSGSWGKVLLHVITVMLGLTVLAISLGNVLAIVSELENAALRIVQLSILGVFLVLSMPYLASVHYVLYRGLAAAGGGSGTGGAG